MKYCILLWVLIFNVSVGLAQKINIKGKIADENRYPLPYVNVFIEDSYTGTISNKDGIFNLSIPADWQNKNLIVKSIGYRSDTIRINPSRTFYQVQLQSLSYPIGEVSVSPDDSLKRIIRKAIEKIPENYLHVDSRQIGFYREYMKGKDEYLYFGEAVLDFFQPSYAKKDEGSVKILKSRISKPMDPDSVPNVYFYGGHTFHTRWDFVKQRKEFLNQNHIKSYNYHIDSVIIDEGKTFWKIGVSPVFRSNGYCKGFFLLDSESLVITEINFEYTQAGLDNRSRELFPIMKSQFRHIVLLYMGEVGEYYLKYVSDNEILTKRNTKKEYRLFNEYLTTSLDTVNNKPIPFEEQNELGTIFSTYATDYSETDWKDYTILTQDSSMKELEMTGISNDESAKVLAKKFEASLGKRLMKTLTNIAVRTFADVSVRMREFSSEAPVQFKYMPDGTHLFPMAYERVNDDQVYSFGIMMGYRITNRMGVFIESEARLGDHYYRSDAFGLRYNMAMKNYGKRLFFTPSVKLGTDHYGVYAGKQDNSGSFYAGGRKFNAEKLSFWVGESTINETLGVSLKKEISRMLGLSFSLEYAASLKATPKLFIKEASGFGLTRKTGREKIVPGADFNMDENTLAAIKDLSLERFGFKIALEFGR